MIAQKQKTRSRILPVLLPLLCLPLFVGAFCGNKRTRSLEELQHENACVKYQTENDLGRAEVACDLCLEYAKGRNAECLNSLGLINLLRDNREGARDYFKKAMREFNDFAQARNNMGYMEFQEGRFKAAAGFFEQSIEIDPRYQDGRYNLALSYLRMGQSAYANQKDPTAFYKKAETQYRRLFELYPEDLRAYHDMGVIMSYRAEVAETENKKLDFVKDAESYWVRCLDLDPAYETCHGNLAHLFLASGRFDESLFHYIQCLAANKENPICGAELPAAYQGSQMQSESLRKYIDQLAQNPGYAPGHYGFCIALFEKGLTNQAVTECENTLKLDDKQCLAYYRLGTHYKTVLDKDQALKNCRGLIECAGESRYEDEVEECKSIVRKLEVQ